MGSTVVRFNKLMLIIMVSSLLIVISLISSARIKLFFHTNKLYKIGYLGYTLAILLLIYSTYYMLTYWVILEGSCSGYKYAFRNPDTLKMLGDFYQPLNQFDSCYFGNGILLNDFILESKNIDF